MDVSGVLASLLVLETLPLTFPSQVFAAKFLVFLVTRFRGARCPAGFRERTPQLLLPQVLWRRGSPLKSQTAPTQITKIVMKARIRAIGRTIDAIVWHCCCALTHWADRDLSDHVVDLGAS